MFWGGKGGRFLIKNSNFLNSVNRVDVCRVYVSSSMSFGSLPFKESFFLSLSRQIYGHRVFHNDSLSAEYAEMSFLIPDISNLCLPFFLSSFARGLRFC